MIAQPRLLCAVPPPVPCTSVMEWAKTLLHTRSLSVNYSHTVLAIVTFVVETLSLSGTISVVPRDARMSNGHNNFTNKMNGLFEPRDAGMSNFHNELVRINKNFGLGCSHRRVLRPATACIGLKSLQKNNVWLASSCSAYAKELSNLPILTTYARKLPWPVKNRLRYKFTPPCYGPTYVLRSLISLAVQHPPFPPVCRRVFSDLGAC
ncbi:hypothetical protein J6590_024279 [Homalodisca vitripennis]|nr:hypothetical protein J6590_024279 [Homalodisca vitripennis]